MDAANASAVQFLAYLERERNYSPRTCEAYRSDIFAYYAFLQKHFEGKPAKFDGVDHLTIRLYLGELSEQGYKRNPSRANWRRYGRFTVFW